ncbi:MAG: glycosyltransferase [Elainellaceae cyanobacterium]
MVTKSPFPKKKSTATPSPNAADAQYRVAIIHPSAGVNWSGGTENFAIEMSRHLSPYFDVELLGGDPIVPNYYPAGGVPRTIGRKMFRQPWIYPALKRISTHPDIVFEHLTSFPGCALRLLTHPADLIFPCNDYGGMAAAAFVRCFRHTPILFKAHTGLLGGGKSLSRALKFHPDHLVVFSSEMEDYVRNAHPQQSTSIIPNGVDMVRFSPQQQPISIDMPRPIILCVASLDRRDHKRVHLAIDAVQRLGKGSLLICGGGPDRDYYQAMGEEKLGRDRILIRTFPFDEMPSVFRSADVFTLSSDREPFGNVYLQAMACNIPVVTTDEESPRAIVAAAGVFCDVTDADAYAAALAQALERDWGDIPRENASRFSWENIAAQYRDLMVSMIQSCPKPVKSTS